MTEDTKLVEESIEEEVIEEESENDKTDVKNIEFEDNIIIKGVHITICNHNGGENFISTIIANKTIKICLSLFKKMH